MRLLYAKASPFTRKVMVLLHETGMIGDIEIIEVQTTPFDPDAAAADANPSGKIPCLIRDDGMALYDSRVITRYLDTLHDGAKLYPEGDALWRALVLEATADAMMEAALAIVYERRFRAQERQWPEWMEAQRRKIERAVDMLDAGEAAHPAAPFDMGRAAIACALGYVDFRLGDWDWRDGRPALAAWFDGAARRASMQATRPE